MTDIYGRGRRVIYTGPLPGQHLIHYGRVITEPRPVLGVMRALVRFGCCETTRDLPLDQLQPA